MPISPAELRDLLRGDAVHLALFGVLLIVGTVALAMTAMLGRRAAPLLGLAVFAHLYGVRLLIRTETFRLYADTPPATWDHAEAAITYTGAHSDRALRARHLPDLAALLDQSARLA